MGTTDSLLHRQVMFAARNLSDEELALLNRVMQDNLDPRTLPFYSVVAHLFRRGRGGVPITYKAVKEAIAKIVSSRL